MNIIQPIGQAITSTNYTTARIFNFNPEMIQKVGENFLASGITCIEVPEGVLDPNGKFSETGLDEQAVRETIRLLPPETKMISSYFGPGTVGTDKKAFLTSAKRKIDHFIKFFPDFTRTMIHPPRLPGVGSPKAEIRNVVEAWVELARYAASERPGFQCCLHNHYDSSCETADQVRMYLDAIAEADEPALRWGPDTGHSAGMGDQYLAIFEEYAPLIGNHFHIKARVAAFDQLHGGKAYDAKRDMWRNEAEFGRGLYGGFVNCADPEIETPFKEVFAIIRAKARPAKGVITAAIEIDYPRQHPRLEVMCSVFYLRTVHGIEPDLKLTNDQIVARVFAGR